MFIVDHAVLCDIIYKVSEQYRPNTLWATDVEFSIGIMNRSHCCVEQGKKKPGIINFYAYPY